MSTRKIIDPKQNGEKVWLKGHAQAIYMSDGSTVEDAINSIEIPSLDEYVTETELNDKGFLTEHQDISHLVTKVEVSESIADIDFYDIQNNPVVNTEEGKLLFVDETGNIGLQLEGDMLYVKDVVAGNNILSNKADKSYVDSSISNLVDSAPETLNTLNELAEAIQENEDVVEVLNQSIGSKQNIITDLESIRQGAAKGATALQSYTEQYKGTVTGVKVNGNTKSPSNGVVDLGTVITSHQDISGKQDTLVSGTNIKTINGESLLGEGNIVIPQIIYIPNKASMPETQIEGVLYLIGGEVEVIMINFSVDDNTYQAEQGMTWKTWVNSDYNWSEELNAKMFNIDEYGYVYDYEQRMIYDKNSDTSVEQYDVINGLKIYSTEGPPILA